MRFFIADPSLYGEGGHNYDYAVEAAHVAAGKGAQVLLLANRRFHSRQSPPIDLSVRPVFRQGLRQSESLATRFTASVDARLRRLFARDLDPVTHPPFEPLFKRGRTLIRDITTARRQLRPGANDILFFPTITWADGALIAEAAARWEEQIDLVFRFDPPAAQPSRERLARGIAAHPLPRFRIWADTPELARAYESILDRPVHLIRMPFPPLQRTASRARSVAFLGESRKDKGFHLLPAIVKEAAKLPPERRIAFDVQILASGPASPAITEAIGALENMRTPGLELYRGPLTTAAYNAVMSSTAAVLCLYDSDQYKLRSAGVVTQAVAAGIPVVMASGHSAPMEMIRRNDCLDLVRCCDVNPLEIVKALDAALQIPMSGPRHLDCVEAWSAPWLFAPIEP